METLQKIIHGPVPSLSADVPLALRILVEKALDKDPAARYQSTRDLAVDLRRLLRQSDEGTPAALPFVAKQQPSRVAKNVITLTSVILAILLFAAGGLLIWFRRPIESSPGQAVEFEVPPPTGTLFAPPINRQPFAISPDGQRLAFTAASTTGTNLWMRQLNSTGMHAVPGTEGAISVSWAPDSRSIFFSTKQTLMQLNLETGSGRSVATLPSHAQLVTWRLNGNLLIYLGPHDSYELSAADGSLQRLVANVPGRWPQFLPGSDRLLYADFDATARSYRAMVSDYPVHKPVALMETDSRVQYAPPRLAGQPGHLLFMRGANLLAQAFDEGRSRLVGDAFPIAQNVIYYGPTLAANFSASSNGVLVYQAGFPVSELHWYDRAGNVAGQVGKPAMHWGNVRISRDGRRVAATVWTPETGGAGIWIFDANGSASAGLPIRRMCNAGPYGLPMANTSRLVDRRTWEEVHGSRSWTWVRRARWLPQPRNLTRTS